MASRTTPDLLAAVFPEVPARREFGPYESPLSIEKARRILGYAPEYSWRD
jgi:UDP-glucose 4-epimerase